MHTRAAVARHPAASDPIGAFYTQHPYPPPVENLDRAREDWGDEYRRRAEFHLLWPHRRYPARLDILVAGCGTWQAAKYAISRSDSRVIGIDISPTSLAYTEQLKRRHALTNLTTTLLPLERVAELGRSFDLIVCTGVLHHLPDPDAGLRALRNVLKPDGALQLMVYGAYGRAGIYMIQEYCRLLGVTDSAQDLRDLAAALGGLPGDHPLANTFLHAKDFRHPDSLADALLHPQDRAFTVPQVYAWLERCGLTFGRWYQQAPYLAQCGVMATTPHSARLAALPAPAQHAAVELFRGTIAKHHLIAYRDDHPEEGQPITFVGHGWREYIPMVLPWTTCIRDRVPPGRVAVLINRAHVFADLALAVDSSEDRCQIGRASCRERQ